MWRQQIGLAIQNHHDTYKFLPHGGNHWSNAPAYSNGTPQAGRTQLAGWGFQILPFLEGNNLWEGSGAPDDAERQRRAIAAAIEAYHCPARRAAEAHPPVNSWYGPSGSYRHGQTDYAGSNIENNGAIIRMTGGAGAQLMRFASITDGTSSTMIVGEKRLNVARLGSYQGDDNEGYSSGWDHDVMRYTSRQPLPDPKSGDGNQRFGSSHPGGFHGLLVDGSVQFVNYNIALAMFQRIGNRQDGQTVDF